MSAKLLWFASGYLTHMGVKAWVRMRDDEQDVGASVQFKVYRPTGDVTVYEKKTYVNDEGKKVTSIRIHPTGIRDHYCDNWYSRHTTY